MLREYETEWHGDVRPAFRELCVLIEVNDDGPRSRCESDRRKTEMEPEMAKSGAALKDITVIVDNGGERRSATGRRRPRAA